MKNSIKSKLLHLVLLGAGLLLASVSNAQPVITNQTVILGGNTTFSVMATGVGPLTYQWLLNGTNLPNNIITTVAGGNLFNNLQATNTILNSPAGVATDTNGNLYIVDTVNNVIRKVTTNGVAKIIAGTGVGFLSGDGGVATNANFYFPNAVVVSPSGTIYISDNGNNCIRKVDTNGIITKVAGNGTNGFTGDGGVATNARISSPLGIFLDTAGNLFFADSQNNRIRKVATTGIITTVAGNGFSPGFGGDGSSATSATLNFPSGVVVDSSGNMFIADTGNSRIRKVNTGGTISTVVGTGTAGYSGDGGAATSAKINNPDGVAFDKFGNLLIVDTGNHCIRKLTNSIITTVAGSGTNGYAGDGGLATNANISLPQNVSVDTIGNLFIADYGNNRIRKVGTNGVITTVAGHILNDGDYATNATLGLPYGSAIDPLGNIFIPDTYNNRVRKVDANGIITTVVGNGIPAYAGDGGLATNVSLKNPLGVALDTAGNLFIADSANYRIRKVDTNGIITTVAGSGTNGFAGDGGMATNAKMTRPYGVSVDIAGNLFITDQSNQRIRKVDTNGIISTVAGNGSFGFSGDGGAATSAGIFIPYGTAVDNSGNLFIADGLNNRVRKVNTNGIISTFAGTGTNGFSGDGGKATNANLSIPSGVALDAIGNVFISDANDVVVRKVSTNGIISTIAGSGVVGVVGVGGDGGPANQASFSTLHGVTTDGAGNVYIADSGNNRLRKLTYVDYADQPTLTVTNLTAGSVSNHYSVIVTSAAGSVTSSVVAVNVQLPPIVPAFTASNGLYQFTWSAVSNQTYQLQCATNLAAPIWLDLGSPITATSNSVFTTDAIGTNSQRFYRIRTVP